MKKTLSLLLAVMMLLTSFAFTVNAEGQKLTGPIVFSLVDDNGQVPSGKGKNGECYFPQKTTEKNPELYTWNTGTVTGDGGFAVFRPKDGSGMLEFDSFPGNLKWSADRKLTYLVLNIKTELPAETTISVLAQGAKFKKSFKVNFSSGWQQIIIDLNDPTGWYQKNADNKYDAISYSPMKDGEGKQIMVGGFRLDVPGSLIIGKVTIDYIGLFGSPEEAKAYKGRKDVEVSRVYTGTVESAKTEVKEESDEVVDEGSSELGKAVIFTLAENIELAKGRNGDCYFPTGTSEENPEIYTWNSGSMTSDNGYAVYNAGGGNSIMEFDSFPKEKTWSADKKLSYIAFVVKASSVATSDINVVAQGGKFKKTFKVPFTGDWQLVILDLNDPTGWYQKGADGIMAAINYSPMKDAEGKQVMTGGFRLDFPAKSVIASYKFDYIGIFESIASAKAYKNRETVKTAEVFNGNTGASTTTSTSTTTTTTEAKEEVVKPIMKDALTRGKEKIDNSITLVSAVEKSIVDDKKLVYKYSNLGTYEEETKKYPILDDEATNYIQTWGMGTFEKTSAGILKYKSNASGGTLFEAHPKKAPTFGKHKYFVIGYKTNDDYSDRRNTAYFYTSGNTFRIPFNINIDSNWHYDLFDMSKLDVFVKDGGYKEKATDTSTINLGAFRIDFPVIVGIEFYIDYIGFFVNEEEAKEFIAKSEAAVALDKGKIVEEEKFVYMKGYVDGTFKPGSQMTRAEAATVIARLLADESVIAADRDTAFTDVKKGDWYYSYVTYLEQLGYLPNYNGEFKPNQNITRGEFVKLAFEAGGIEFSMKRPDFSDLDKNHPYYKEIVFASGTGIVNGYNNGDGTMSFKPDGEITRAEIATIVNRILKIEAAPDSKQEFSDLDSSHWAYGTIMAIAAKN